MDDLLGEDWQSAPKQSKTSSSAFAADYASLRPSPRPVASASASPLILSRPSSTVTAGSSRPASTTPKPAEDAFGSLVGLKSGKASSGASVSIQERQRQLVEERQRQLAEQGKLWDNLGSGKAGTGSQQAIAATRNDEDEEDILAAFNKDVKVDNASHYPPPIVPSSQPASGRGTPAIQPQQTPSAPERQRQRHDDFADDDDTFGLGKLAVKSNGHVKTAITTNEDDDILGDLGRPVSAKLVVNPTPADDSFDSDAPWDENVANSRTRQGESSPSDKALAELVDMGFPVDSARIALSQNGGNVQHAVGWLLRQAHEESKQKAKEMQDGQGDRRRDGSAHTSDRRGRGTAEHTSSRNGFRDQENGQTNGSGEKDAAQMAQDFGNKLFKSANSLWKASQKQMAKTMAEFQQERDPSQPRWMQSSSNGSSRDGSQRPAREAPSNVTNEAALLDMPRSDVPTRTSKPTRALDGSGSSSTRTQSPAHSARSTPQPFQDRRPAAKLTRQAVEEQSAQAYVSPARRRKAAPPAQAEEPPATLLQDEPEVDLFSSPAPVQKAPEPVQRSRPTPSPSPRPAAPARSVPSVSAAALSTSANHRKKGTDAFKLGDYASAHEAYTAALTPLPQTHPLLIVILSNRSLTALKTGDPKTAISDADRALELIGPGLGAGESIDVDGDSKKDMREFYGKALMRKAEALEHMEKWRDAGAVWRLAVEAGVGGAISIRGKDRCERAIAPKPAAANPVDRVKKAAPAKPKSTAPRPAATSKSSTDAVKKLREANAAAERADDEKFQLADQVEARLTAWKGGKADNLRALLQSMDTVLWSGAGWKKVGMSDLVMANKVKIIYMKAIAKVHPDKIAPDASTEQRMISTAVFSTLNEAWDKFKKDNSL